MDEKDTPEWRERVDSVILYDRIEELRARIRDLEHIVIKGKDNLRSEYRRHDELLTRIYAVLFQDATGQKGVLHDLDVLMGRRRVRDESRGLKWQFWGVVLAAAIAGLTAILTHLPQIKRELLREDPLEKKINKIKNPKPRYIHYKIRALPPEEPKENPPSANE